MIKDINKETQEKNLKSKLDSFLSQNKKECSGEECLISDPEELVKREHKRIVTNDGRQLLSEYTI